MKATIDIPDDLYQRVKARTALKGRAVRDVIIGLFRNLLQESETTTQDRRERPESWADQLLLHALPADFPGPTAREILQEDRGRRSLRCHRGLERNDAGHLGQRTDRTSRWRDTR